MNAVEAAKRIPGWMTEEELRWLAEQAKGRKCIAEIGSWQGRSTKALALSAKGVVYSIDNLKGEADSPVEDLDALFYRHLAPEIETRKVQVTRHSSLVAVQMLAGFDMVFIDGDHEYPAPLEDIKAWSKRLLPGGLLCGHDASSPGVVRSLQESGIDYEVVAGQIWAAR